MNYPAYFNNDAKVQNAISNSNLNSNIKKYSRNKTEGLGYTYSAEKLFTFQKTKINEILTP